MIDTPEKREPWRKICNAHGIPYVATLAVCFPQDIQRKVKKAFSIKGPKYIQIFVPCPLGWRSDPGDSIEIAKAAVETGFYPLIEYENGILTSVRKIKQRPIEDYLKLQGRFKHILKSPEQIKLVQDIANKNIEKYGLAA